MSFLNKKQQKELKEKEWSPRPEGFWLTVYPENFEHPDGWRDFLNNAGADPDAIGVSVVCFGIVNEKDEEGE